MLLSPRAAVTAVGGRARDRMGRMLGKPILRARTSALLANKRTMQEIIMFHMLTSSTILVLK
jgi:molybdenum cofactor biosynthesis enzyme